MSAGVASDGEARILVVYWSRDGSTATLARHVARGAGSVAGATVSLRTLPEVSPVTEATAARIPPEGPPYATLEELARADGLLLGSPTRFGNMAAAVKHFLDQTGKLWVGGGLAGKPAGVFTSTGTMHGGQETTLVSMMLPLIHHGMLIVGLPYTEADLTRTRTGGGPYGASHVAGDPPSPSLSDEERALAQALGRRVARAAVALKGHAL